MNEKLKKDIEINFQKNSNLENISNEELDFLESKFTMLSEEFRIEKEAYDKKMSELEDKIKQLKEEILALEKEEELENNVTLEPIPEKIKEPENDVALEPTSEDIKKDNSIEEILDNTIENLSTEEKEALKTEMENNEPLSFENEEVKTNIKTFLGNEIVKNLSGFRVSEKIKTILRRSTKYVLTAAVIATTWSGTNEKYPLNSKDFNNKDKTTITKDSEKKENTASTVSPFAKTENDEYQILPSNMQRIYSYAVENIKDSYIIIDKPSATLYVFNEKNELVGTMPILLGKTKGEDAHDLKLKTKREVSYALNAKHPKGATTPAGKYKMGGIGEAISKHDIKTYDGRVLWILGSGVALHMTYPGELTTRTKALNTKSTTDNNKSLGCVNLSKENFDKYIKTYFSEENKTIFITPDDPSLTVNPENGKIEKVNQNNYASNINNNYQQNI